jgi:hypothetical protein
MSREHLRYLIVEQGAGAAIVNFVINGVIAWLSFRSLQTVPLWGGKSIGGDLIGTDLLLPLITCLIVTPLAKKQIENGRLSRLMWRRTSHPALRLLPSRTLLRAILIGVICVALIAPPSVAALMAAGVSELRFWPFIWFKAVYAAVLGALVTPVIALCALGDLPKCAVPV